MHTWFVMLDWVTGWPVNDNPLIGEVKNHTIENYSINTEYKYLLRIHESKSVAYEKQKNWLAATITTYHHTLAYQQ
jgi:hypothetical protein